MVKKFGLGPKFTPLWLLVLYFPTPTILVLDQDHQLLAVDSFKIWSEARETSYSWPTISDLWRQELPVRSGQIKPSLLTRQLSLGTVSMLPMIAPLSVLSALCMVASSVATYSASASCNAQLPKPIINQPSLIPCS